MHNIFYGKTLEEIAEFFKNIITTESLDEPEIKEIIGENKDKKIAYYNENEGIKEPEKLEIKPLEKEILSSEVNEKTTKMFKRILDDIGSLHKFLIHILKLCNSSRDDIEIKKLIVKMEKARLKFMKMCSQMNIEIEPNSREFFDIKNYDLALKIARENTEKILDNLILLIFFVGQKEINGDMMLLMFVMLTTNEKLNQLMRNRY